MGTIQEVVALLEACKQQASQLKAAIAADRDAAAQLAGGFRSLGLEGPAVTKLDRAEQRLKDAVGNIDHATGLIEAARFLANSAEHGMTGGVGSGGSGSDGSGNTEGESGAADQGSGHQASFAFDESDDPGTWKGPPSGEELLNQAKEQRRRSASELARQITLKGDDAKDAVAENTRIFDKMVSVKLDGDDFFKPTGTTMAHTQVPSGPELRAPDTSHNVGIADVVMGGVAGAVVIKKATTWTRRKYAHFTAKWRGTNG